MITKEEYGQLNMYRAQGYEWIARDKNGRLFGFQKIPRRYRKTWNFGGVVVNIRGEYFTFIKWEDEKPTKIDDLILDYESHQEITGGNNMNKAELVKEIEEILNNIGINGYRAWEHSMNNDNWTISSKTVRDIFSAIEKHSPDDVKVTVPQFVARWIEGIRAILGHVSLFEAYDELKEDIGDEVRVSEEDRKMAVKICRWIYDNPNIFIDAWRNGYEVEKEKLYTVRLANGDFLCRFKSVGIDWAKGQDYRNDKDFQLTQSEIESVDPRLMQFAVEVE